MIIKKIIRGIAFRFFPICLMSCVGNSPDLLTFKQIPSPYPVVIARNKYDDKVYVVELFLQCKMSKKVLFQDVRLCVDGIAYKRNDNGWPWGYSLSPYVFKNNKLEAQSDFELNYFTNSTLALGVSSFIDSMNSNYCLIEKEIERLKESNQDTIHVGTIAELRATNFKLFNEFLCIDSIDLRYGSDGEFYHLRVPVEMK